MKILEEVFPSQRNPGKSFRFHRHADMHKILTLFSLKNESKNNNAGIYPTFSVKMKASNCFIATLELLLSDLSFGKRISILARSDWKKQNAYDDSRKNPCYRWMLENLIEKIDSLWNSNNVLNEYC